MSCTFWIRRKKIAAMKEKAKQEEIEKAKQEKAMQEKVNVPKKVIAEGTAKKETADIKGGARNGHRTSKKS